MIRIAALLLALLAVPAPPALAQAADAPTFGYWRLECLSPGHALRPPDLPPAARHCVLAQLVTVDEQRRQVVLAVTVEFLDDGATPAIRFRLGSAIRRDHGLGLRVDAGPELAIPIADCDARVCVAVGLLSPPVLARLEAGRGAEVNFILIDGRTLPLQLGLTGFSEGLAALRETRATP